MDLTNKHKSKEGKIYNLPKSVSKYQYGFVLQSQRYGHTYFSTMDYLDIDHAFQACMNYLRDLLMTHKLPIGMTIEETKSKKIKTGMVGVHVTVSDDRNDARVTATLFDALGKHTTKTVGYALQDTVEFDLLLNKAKQMRSKCLQDEATRQINAIPTIVMPVLDNNGLPVKQSLGEI